MSIKPVPSLLLNVDFSTKKIQVFINNTRSILNLYIIFFDSDVTIYMYSTPHMSLFLTNFGYHPTPYPGDIIFEWAVSNSK